MSGKTVYWFVMFTAVMSIVGLLLLIVCAVAGAAAGTGFLLGAAGLICVGILGTIVSMLVSR